jgi:hypothetical protein
MNLSRWLSVSIFAIAVIAAWQYAQPPASSGSLPASVAPGNPYNDAINTRHLIPNRAIVAPSEPIKFSDVRPR